MEKQKNTIVNSLELTARILPFTSPLVGLYDLLKNYLSELPSYENGIKAAFQLLYGVLATAGSFIYLDCLLQSEVYQTQTPHHIKVGIEKTKVTLQNKLFSDDGYANTDGKKGISIAELVDAYKRMGINGAGYGSRTEFPKPSIKQLVQGINSYKSERKNQ